MSVGALSLDTITLDDGLQPRVALNEDTIADYDEQIRQGVEFPPVVVFRDGGAHWLADGWHRYRGTRRPARRPS